MNGLHFLVGFTKLLLLPRKKAVPFSYPPKKEKKKKTMKMSGSFQSFLKKRTSRVKGRRGRGGQAILPLHDDDDQSFFLVPRGLKQDTATTSRTVLGPHNVLDLEKESQAALLSQRLCQKLFGPPLLVTDTGNKLSSHTIVPYCIFHDICSQE